MRALWTACVCVAMLMLGGVSGAQAQVKDSDVRLFLDLGLVSWISDRERSEGPGGDYFGRDNALGAGFAALNRGGVGVGYAVTPSLIPTFYFGLQHERYESEAELGDIEMSGPETIRRQFELRPYLEFAFNPGSRFVLHADAGLSLLRRVFKVDDNDSEDFGIGPVVAVGGHGFVTQHASLDLGLAFRAAFIKDEERKDGLEMGGRDDAKMRELALLFTLGASFWL